jgi:hypothetical protein
MHPSPEDALRRIQSIDPACDFGLERVDETGMYVVECLEALGRYDQKVALKLAQKALKRWQEG